MKMFYIFIDDYMTTDYSQNSELYTQLSAFYASHSPIKKKNVGLASQVMDLLHLCFSPNQGYAFHTMNSPLHTYPSLDQTQIHFFCHGLPGCHGIQDLGSVDSFAQWGGLGITSRNHVARSEYDVQHSKGQGQQYCHVWTDSSDPHCQILTKKISLSEG